MNGMIGLEVNNSWFKDDIRHPEYNPKKYGFFSTCKKCEQLIHKDRDLYEYYEGDYYHNECFENKE